MKKSGRDFQGNRPQAEYFRKDLKKIEKRDQLLIKNNYKSGFTAEELQNSNEMVKKVFTLENSTPSEILQFKIKRAVQQFQRAPNDTASSAVQIAVMTEKIYHLIGHCEEYRKDVKAARSLNQLLDDRRKKLNYLRHSDYHMYRYVIGEYNIPENPPINHHYKQNYRLYRNKTANICSGKARRR
ncbi:S15/NS1, RNA-binding [Pseudocohnilembus persalinus]|uniref:S15/NS1, RNA-binding n=1 Tax=Pseudocohnilembus persalinus TaxID=266149 RepID=A0A0V0QK49_PSEPJ|nr:S15/NS1, RNA-binding [Pseudocohnilembus persalinus]|eukprot:KRX02548.1 S15/NS1, RNA-binding [Pseudocohnilembus persalinus]